MFLLLIKVPQAHLEAVKEAIFKAGAGRVGSYSHSSWQVAGVGQFRPLAGSVPFAGTEGQLERVAEVHLETVCAEEVIEGVIAALKESHPYEVPFYQVLRIERY